MLTHPSLSVHHHPTPASELLHPFNKILLCFVGRLRYRHLSQKLTLSADCTNANSYCSPAIVLRLGPAGWLLDRDQEWLSPNPLCTSSPRPSRYRSACKTTPRPSASLAWSVCCSCCGKTSFVIRCPRSRSIICTASRNRLIRLPTAPWGSVMLPPPRFKSSVVSSQPALVSRNLCSRPPRSG